MNSRACLVVIASLVLAANGCGPEKPEVNEADFLQTIGFNNPLELQLQADQFLYPGGGVQNTENASLIALLVKADYLTVVPRTDRWAGWSFHREQIFAEKGGTVDGQSGKLPVGKRTLVGYSNKSYWKEGAVQFFAEDATYSIELDSKIRAAADISPAKFAFRLVLINDPAVGHWQVVVDSARGTHLPQDDFEKTTAALAAEGARYIPEVLRRIAAARGTAYAMIERNLAASGTIKRSSSDTAVLISSSAGLAYYAKPVTMRSFTMQQVKDYCASLKIQKLSWHVPTIKEWMAVVDQNSHRLYDTPDGRLWRSLGAKNESSWIQFVTSSICDYVCPNPTSESYSMYALPAIVNNPSLVVLSDNDNVLYARQANQFGMGYSVPSEGIMERPLSGGGNDFGREVLVCTAHLPSASNNN